MRAHKVQMSSRATRKISAQAPRARTVLSCCRPHMSERKAALPCRQPPNGVWPAPFPLCIRESRSSEPFPTEKTCSEKARVSYPPRSQFRRACAHRRRGSAKHRILLQHYDALLEYADEARNLGPEQIFGGGDAEEALAMAGRAFRSSKRLAEGTL